MATTVVNLPATPAHQPFDHDEHDVFTDPDADASTHAYQHRFSSKFDLNPLDLSSTSSPSQVKRTIEAHLQETDRRLLDTQKLGTSLLKQREDLSGRLEEVEQYQDDAQIPGDLRKRLADIEREHADVGREVARALIGPRSKQDDLPPVDSGVFTSQATGSPTKISAPSRRHRNQPSTRAGDLQFAADISTSLLAQVRQLQAAVAERDESIKRFHAERDSTDRDLHAYTQKLRALDESEQKYKDENWSLETQKHDLLISAREAQEKEKRLNAGLAAAVAEKNRLQNDLEEINIAHSKLAEDHTTTRKAHDTEIHSLKRNADVADLERQSLQDRVDELIAQNQELAKAVATRSRSRQGDVEDEAIDTHSESAQNIDTPEDSPPPSPTKATPRHGGLESETLRSSLHHAHRMIQNLKGNIHREKTEKIELKRMLQEARDDLEQRRGSEAGSAVKRQKTKPDAFKKPARPDMLGGTRRARTDVELTDDDWEDQHGEGPPQFRPHILLPPAQANAERLTDLSDAYQTANETEGTFDTADERNTTESEAFMTGAESLAGDSTDELTETEDTASRTHSVAPGRIGRTSLANKPAGDRASFFSTASTSADEADLQTPMQPSFAKFKNRSARLSTGKSSLFAQQNTPDSSLSRSISQDSPATVMTEQSPAEGEQTLFAELGGLDEMNSETQSLRSTPARSSILSSQHSTPGLPYTPSKSAIIHKAPTQATPTMVDSSTMTETWAPESTLPSEQLGVHDVEAKRDSGVAASTLEKVLLPSAFPLPPSVPASPIRKTDTSTQYTPQRGLADSPMRPGSSYITPPKMAWDDEQVGTPSHNEHQGIASNGGLVQPLEFSGVLSQDSPPLDASVDVRAALTRDLEASRNEITLLRTNLDQKHAHAEMLQKGHAALARDLEASQNAIVVLRTDLDQRNAHAEMLQKGHAALTRDLEASRNDIVLLRIDHAQRQANTDTLQTDHTARTRDLQASLNEIVLLRTNLDEKHAHTEALQTGHAALSRDLEASQNDIVVLRSNLGQKQAHMETLQKDHTEELNFLRSQITEYSQELDNVQGVLRISETENVTNSSEIQRLLGTVRRYKDQLALLSTSAYSSILSQEIHPVSALANQLPIISGNPIVGSSDYPDTPKTPERPRTAEKVEDSMLISAAATLDSPIAQRNQASSVLDNEIHGLMPVRNETTDSAISPFRHISDQTDQDFTQRKRMSFVPELVKVHKSRDEGSQTMLTAEQIEEALRPKKSVIAPIAVPARTRSPSARSPTRYPGRPSSRNREVSPIEEDASASVAPSPTRRPGSASSNRNSSLTSQKYPPLPSDHKDIIAKANTQVESPTRREGTTIRAGGIMGPPTMPASAMRRPRTPNESVRSSTPQQGTAKKRGAVGSQVSRRSSMSSFASEIDERFNIRPDQQAGTHGFVAGPGTDPRMIQAITQTMIGEFLWKYTRKAGSKEMSTTRHRRYFWVHPYTKTLYWSEQDPQTAGRSEIKAKSVAIESVRVVSDDNPMPPGLHRKSLEVTTPGRKVKFTASTGQRHETWFNALSYLLHRGEEQETAGAYGTGNNDITPADIAEFSVNGYGARLVPHDRMSMSSYNSRTTRGTVSNRASQTTRQSFTPGTLTGSSSQNGPGQGQLPATQANQDTIRRSRTEGPPVPDKDRTVGAGGVSRITRMFGSVTGKSRMDNGPEAGQASRQIRQNAGDNNSIYNASVVSDGRREEEDQAKRQQERENNPGLEDVRACCDGKHNVSTLPHRHTSTSTTQNRISNAINRSMSRRT